MKVVLKRAATPYHFQLEAGSGHTVVTDAAAAIGGTDRGMRPMELLLSSLASCSAIDIVQILGKQRAELHDLEVEVNGKRRENVLPAVFESIHVHFRLWGDLDHYKVERALELTFEKYCSVAVMLKHSARITHGYELVAALPDLQTHQRTTPS